MWNDFFVSLYKRKQSAVFFAKYTDQRNTPEKNAQILCKKLTQSKKTNPHITQALLICESSIQHKRLNHIDELIVSFLIQKNKTKSIKSAFQIKKISIQKKIFNNDKLFEKFKQYSKFKDYLNNFKKTEADKLIFVPNEILELIPIVVPKPWGQEIWFSGIENRGISEVKSSQNANTKSIPLSWLLGSVPNLALGSKFADRDIVLIKILDPSKDPIVGDLYYELHTEKNEVYVVLDVANETGKIKIGINEEKFKAYNNNQEHYKSDFLKQIENYEIVRRKIDNLKDKDEKIPQSLEILEHSLRESMDAFSGFIPLSIGDVINVPTHTPHALQHGVKVIEFQTPTYERLIISFAQKVLTQSHWDTKQAFEIMRLQPFQKNDLKILSKTRHAIKELVCQFKDFFVVRLKISKNKEYPFFTQKSYHILFHIKGHLKIKNETRQKSKNPFIRNADSNTIYAKKDQCLLLPPNRKISFSTNSECLFLVCTPIE